MHASYTYIADNGTVTCIELMSCIPLLTVQFGKQQSARAHMRMVRPHGIGCVPGGLPTLSLAPDKLVGFPKFLPAP